MDIEKLVRKASHGHPLTHTEKALCEQIQAVWNEVRVLKDTLQTMRDKDDAA